jgi:hypothetical protein
MRWERYATAVAPALCMLLGASAKPLLYLLDGLGVDVCARRCLDCSHASQRLRGVRPDIPGLLSRQVSSVDW